MGPVAGNRWVVAAACCWMNIFGFAMLRSTAVIYVGVLQSFNVTREQAAWPLSLAGVCYSFAAPAAGVLARYISVWKLTLAGSVASSIFVSSCYFANGISYLVVSYGISQGTSIAFLSLTHTIINQHFGHYKAVASGISNAGFTIGGLVFPPLAQLFFDRYGLRGGFLLCGALMLNAAAGALLQRGSRPVPVSTSDGQTRDDPHNIRTLQEGSHKTDNSCIAELSTGLLPKSVQTASKYDQAINYEDINVLLDLSIKDEDINVLLSPRGTVKFGPLSAQTMELKKPVVPATEYRSDPSTAVHRLIPQSTLQNRIIRLLSFLAIPKFYVIIFSFTQLLISITTYLTVIVDFAMDRDIPKWNAVLLITIFAAADMVSRLGSGWITDKGFLRRSSMMTLHFLLSTTTLCLLPLCYSYSLNVLASVILGWCNGAIMILIPVFLMELVDTSKFSVCYGTAAFLAGLPLLVRPAIIGYFRDTLGDYQGLFWLFGTLSACNVVLWSWLYASERQRANTSNLINEQRQRKHFQA
ncbi:unnamed protein product [Ixodes hexagonus]